MSHIHRTRSAFEQVDAHTVGKDCPDCLAREAELKKLEQITAIQDKALGKKNVILDAREAEVERLRKLLKERVEGPYRLDDDTGWYECQYCHKGINEAEGKPRDIVHRESCWLLEARQAPEDAPKEGA